jgi:hypothetical protein
MAMAGHNFDDKKDLARSSSGLLQFFGSDISTNFLKYRVAFSLLPVFLAATAAF